MSLRIHIGLNHDTEFKVTEEINKEKTHVLPENIIVGAECFHCVKVLFQQSFISKGASGFHDTCFQSNVKCDVCPRKELHANVVLSGGTTMFQGITIGAKRKLTGRYPPMN